MPQSVIKPKTQNFKRNPSPKAKTSGFKDYLAIAQALDITTRPTRPDFTATMEAKEYATAIAATAGPLSLVAPSATSHPSTHALSPRATSSTRLRAATSLHSRVAALGWRWE